ncbi:MAG: hypothetical protein GXY83_38855 [Rhodopirellula sp.]|nr:hypothetical protein [Rhodopirellula sp.]
MIRTTAFLGLVFLTFSAVADGEESKSDYEHLKPLEWLIGDWVGEYTAPVDLPGVKKGERVISHVSRYWVLDKTAFVTDGVTEANGKRTPLTHELNYWNPTERCVSLLAQSAFGTGKGKFTEVGDTVVLRFASEKEGVLAGTATLEKIDQNSYTWQITDLTLADEKTPDWPKVTFRKTGVALAAKDGKSAAAQLEDLAWLIGDWEGEFKLPKGLEEVGPEGAKVRSFESWRWGLGKKFILMNWREEIDGKHVVTSHYVIGPNLETGALSTWFFESLGGHGTGTWRSDGDKLVTPWRSFTPSGKKYQGVSDSVRIDDDTYLWQVRDVTESGKKLPDWPKITLKRKKPCVSELTADDYIAYHKPLLGSWKTIVEEEGKIHTGIANWQLAANKKCFLVDFTMEGYPAMQALIGYDPVSGKCIQTNFDADGTFQRATLEIAGMKKGKVLGEGLVGNWEERRFSPDSTVVTAHETVHCTELSKDRITCVWSNRREGGKSLPDWKLTYERP